MTALPADYWLPTTPEKRWRALANCLGRDPNIFFPEDDVHDRPHLYDQAREICAACLVTEQCAVAGRHEKHGMWGGMSEPQRHPKNRHRLRVVTGAAS